LSSLSPQNLQDGLWPLEALVVKYDSVFLSCFFVRHARAISFFLIFKIIE
jgi:hypothetical protein